MTRSPSHLRSARGRRVHRGFQRWSVIGTDEQVKKRVREELDAIRPPTSLWSAESGWEQVTLTRLHEWTQDHDGSVMYGHTKGAYNIGAFQDVLGVNG